MNDALRYIDVSPMLAVFVVVLGGALLSALWLATDSRVRVALLAGGGCFAVLLLLWRRRGESD